MTEPFEGQILPIPCVPVYKAALQWHKFDDGESMGYRIEEKVFRRKDDALAFIRIHRRYLASKRRAQAWAAREGVEGYLVAVLPLCICWEPVQHPKAQLAALPEEMTNWQRPEWLQEED